MISKFALKMIFNLITITLLFSIVNSAKLSGVSSHRGADAYRIMEKQLKEDVQQNSTTRPRTAAQVQYPPEIYRNRHPLNFSTMKYNSSRVHVNNIPGDRFLPPSYNGLYNANGQRISPGIFYNDPRLKSRTTTEPPTSRSSYPISSVKPDESNLDLTTDGRNLDLTTDESNLDLTTDGRNLDLTTDGRNLNLATDERINDSTINERVEDLTNDGKFKDLATDDEDNHETTESSYKSYIGDTKSQTDHPKSVETSSNQPNTVDTPNFTSHPVTTKKVKTTKLNNVHRFRGIAIYTTTLPEEEGKSSKPTLDEEDNVHTHHLGETFIHTPVGEVDAHDAGLIMYVLILVIVVLFISLCVVGGYWIKAKCQVNKLDKKMRRACIKGLEDRDFEDRF